MHVVKSSTDNYIFMFRKLLSLIRFCAIYSNLTYPDHTEV